jgi:putative SOS response-associated peptidase YedK
MLQGTQTESSIATSRTWREAMKKRRCLIPVNAVYEWPKEGKPPKQPYAFELSSGNLLAFAGIWDAWKEWEGDWLQSYAIVTTEANELMSHTSTMRVILHLRDYDRWLDREKMGRLSARKDPANGGRGLVEEPFYGSEVEGPHP